MPVESYVFIGKIRGNYMRKIRKSLKEIIGLSYIAPTYIGDSPQDRNESDYPILKETIAGSIIGGAVGASAYLATLPLYFGVPKVGEFMDNNTMPLSLLLFLTPVVTNSISGIYEKIKDNVSGNSIRV